MDAIKPPEHNVTGIDFGERGHLRYAGPPLIDVHAHVVVTRPGDGRAAGVIVDGVAQADGAVPLVDDRREHSVEVRISEP
jgi:hypothetical protein